MSILPKNELIKIQNLQVSHKDTNSVNARDIWSFIESKQDFSTWIKKRLEQLGAIEKEDYIKAPQKNGASKTGQSIIEYIVTINIAKHLAMMERNEKGKEARQYFINVEEAYKKEMTCLTTVLKKNIDFIELNSSEEEFKDDENYLLKRYLYALEQNGTHVQRFIIKLIEENHKQKLDLELKTKDLISQNFLVNKAQEYTTPVSKLFQRFYQYIKENESSFKIIPKYDNFRANIDTRAVFPFGIIDRKENTLVITVKELNIFCDRNNFSNREFLNAFSERGLLIKDNESMNLNCTYVNCYMFKDIYL